MELGDIDLMNDASDAPFKKACLEVSASVKEQSSGASSVQPVVESSPKSGVDAAVQSADLSVPKSGVSSVPAVKSGLSNVVSESAEKAAEKA